MNKAEKCAKEVLVQHKTSKPAIPVESIVKTYGIRVVLKPFDAEADFNDVSGMLYRTPADVVIGLNASHSVTRQRFSLAHELGHFLLHKGDVFVDAKVNFRNRLSAMGVDREEIEANAFAAELLMPAEMLSSDFYEIFKRDNSDAHTSLIQSLATRYEVSEMAMEFRLKNLGLLQIE